MPSSPKLALLGVPFDGNSSYMRGPAEAPARIREALRCDSTNTWAENGSNIGEQLQDLGDVHFEPASDAMQAIADFVAGVLRNGFRPIILGGDHSLTYATVSAFAKLYPDLSILHFDAHPDLYDEFQGSRYSHACPFARIMEAGLVRRLVQVGIRTINAHQRQQAKRFGVETLEMKAMKSLPGKLAKLDSPVYVSFDL